MSDDDLAVILEAFREAWAPTELLLASMPWARDPFSLEPVPPSSIMTPSRARAAMRTVLDAVLCKYSGPAVAEARRRIEAALDQAVARFERTTPGWYR